MVNSMLRTKMKNWPSPYMDSAVAAAAAAASVTIQRRWHLWFACGLSQQ